MKTIEMGLNTAPYFVNADEVIARFKANGDERGAESREKMRSETRELRDLIVEAVEADGSCELNWSCTGATLFGILACQWRSAMPEYRFEIGRYSCKVFKK